MSIRTVLVLANPYSGTGPNHKRVARLEAALRDAGFDAQVVWSLDERDGRLRALDPESSCVVAAGGDGSIADVVNQMDAAGRLDVAFATLPVGNENLFAQEFGFGLKVGPMVDAIRRGRTRAVDLARLRVEPGGGGSDYAAKAEVDGRLLTLMASAGLDAEVIRRLDRWRKNLPDGRVRRVRRMTYLPKILGSVLGYRYPAIELVADGEPVRGHQAYVFNLPRYGGGFDFAPDARADDGQLSWVVFRDPGLFKLLGYHLKVLRRKHLGCDRVAHGTAERVSLRAVDRQPAPVQADGDPAGPTPIGVEVLPAALHVIDTRSATDPG
ncbi:MAG: diacylglycerol kinase family protein [Planctomycetota bacterium]